MLSFHAWLECKSALHAGSLAVKAGKKKKSENDFVILQEQFW